MFGITVISPILLLIMACGKDILPLNIDEDPFSVLDNGYAEKDFKTTQYSDISDDDFEIPVSQKRLPT